MGKKSRKTPRAAASPTGRKTPRVDAAADFATSRPSWSFALVDLEGFDVAGTLVGWRHLSAESVPGLLERFKRWETMSWSEILVHAKKHNHSIAVEACCKEARQRLEQLQLDDVDELVSLRVQSKARVFGIRDRDVFRILWWDPEHRVCPSTLKGT